MESVLLLQFTARGRSQYNAIVLIVIEKKQIDDFEQVFEGLIPQTWMMVPETYLLCFSDLIHNRRNLL